MANSQRWPCRHIVPPPGRRSTRRRARAWRRWWWHRRIPWRNAGLARLCGAESGLFWDVRTAARARQHPVGILRTGNRLDAGAAMAARSLSGGLGRIAGRRTGVAPRPEINAVAAWVPSGVVFWALGLAEPGDMRPRASWTFRGEPLPYLQENNSAVGAAPATQPGRPIAYAPIYLSHLQDKQAVERATIPVEKIKGPVQLVSGTDDQQWPSSALADIAARRLQEHRHPYPFEHLKYEGAGHRILLPYGPRTVRVMGFPVQGLEGGLYSQGGTPRLDAEAGVDAWRQLLDFLRKGVRARG